MIGCGALGLIHTQRLNAIAGVEIVGVCDPSPEAMSRCRDSALDPENVRDFSDCKTMLNELKLDAVCISSPNPFHVEQIIDSLEAGCHALCEKPLTMDLEEAKKVALVALVAKNTSLSGINPDIEGTLALSNAPFNLESGGKSIRSISLRAKTG